LSFVALVLVAAVVVRVLMTRHQATPPARAASEVPTFDI
jgi:hypothetical protein